MPTNDTLAVFTPLSNEPPTSGYATLDVRNAQPVLDFGDATDAAAVFSGVVPRLYAGGGFTLTIGWAATTATSGDVRWTAAFERHADDVDDLDTDSFATAQAVTATTASAAGELKYTEITFAAAEIDGLLAGEHFRLKITRDADHGADTLAGDAELIAVELRET